MASDTIVHRLLQQANAQPHATAYSEKVGDDWKACTWQEYAKQVRRAARALLSLGVGRKQSRDPHHADLDQSAPCVAILGFNAPEWNVLALATMAVGGAPAGIYTTNAPSEVAYIVGHTEARVVLVENAEQWAKIAQTRDELPYLEKVVLMRGSEAVDDPMVLTWEAFLAQADETADEVLDEYIEALEPDGLATLIYTSGTTGPPKGVMLSHNNVAWTARAAAELIGAGPADALLSYLPLSHIAEQMFSIHIPITAGYAVYFAESMEKLPDNLKEVQPTLFFAVPRIYEKFYAGVQSKLEAAPDLRRKLVALAQRIGTVHNDAANRGELPHPVVDLVYGAAQTVIFDKLKTALGLGRARVCVTGAAPIAAEIIEFFASLDIVIREVYGQSEGCGPTSFNVAGRTRFGSVGPAFPGVDVVIADDGEIKVSGPNVFMGYFKDAEATAETLVDGWLHSGDLGRIDSDGFLHITGRKKDLIITAGGKNIAPKNIEAALKDHPLVGEAVVIGDRRKFLTALIALDAERAEAKSAELGVSLEDLGDHPTIRADLERHVEAVNEHLARVEQVKRFSVLPRPFTPQSGELTPTLKVKRRVVSERYAEAIENMYGGDLEDRAKAS